MHGQKNIKLHINLLRYMQYYIQDYYARPSYPNVALI